MMRGTTAEGLIAQGPRGLPCFHALGPKMLHFTRNNALALLSTSYRSAYNKRLRPWGAPHGDASPEIQPPTPTVQHSVPILPSQSPRSLLGVFIIKRQIIGE